MIQVIVTTVTFFFAHGLILSKPELKAPAVHEMDYGTELFIDDVCIQEMRGVKRVLHSANQLTQPALSFDKPWEQVRENQCSGCTFSARLCLTRRWTSIECCTWVAWDLSTATQSLAYTSHVPQTVTAPCSGAAAKIGRQGFC